MAHASCIEGDRKVAFVVSTVDKRKDDAQLEQALVPNRGPA
jgi:hypothetical protein